MKFTKKEIIRSSGRRWGNVHTVAFSTEEGAFLHGQVMIEERVALDFGKEDSKVEVRGKPIQSLGRTTSKP